MATTYDKASLVMIPSGYKDDKLYSVKPTDGSGDFTFSRDGSGASPATRVNASGLIEKGRENVLLQSNQFDTTWSLVNASVTGGQSGYDGSSDAWLLESTASGVSGSVRQFVSLSGVGTFIVYAKAGNVNFIAMYVASSGADFNLWADLSSGSIGTTASDIETTITSVGGGWYRITLTGLNPDQRVDIYPANADGSYVTGTGENIYIQDAQLEQGLVATAPAIETTTTPVSAGLLGDMPRLDYSGGATCPSLLLEPSRVNLVTQSELVTTSITNVGYTASENDATSPEGVVNAGKILETTGTTHLVQKTFSVASTTASYAVSFFVKGIGRTRGTISYELNGAPYNSVSATFNLAEVTITDAVASGTGAVAGESGIEPMGNDWYRITLSGVVGIAGTHFVRLFGRDDSGNTSYVGDPTKGFNVYGFQAELGSYPTSYIPTYGSASTRAKDYMVTSTLSNDILPTGSFSVMWEADLEQSDIQFDDLFNISGSSAGSRWEARVNNQVRFQGGGYISGDNPNSTIVGTISSKKFGATFSASQIKLYTDGALISTFNGSYDTDYETIGNNIQGTSVIEKQILLFPSVLTESEMIALTTI